MFMLPVVPQEHVKESLIPGNQHAMVLLYRKLVLRYQSTPAHANAQRPVHQM